MSLLTPYRALDLTNEKGLFCGKILSDLGAEVIKVERPGGDPSRLTPPFYGDTPHPERSLFWFAYNQGKKGVTLNLEAPAGRELFFRLLQTANWVIESFGPGYLEKIALGYDVLVEVDPAIILTRISAFGQTGPYAGYKGADMIVAAMGGSMYVTGDHDRRPVCVSSPQTYLCASADAAVGSLLALCYQQTSGKGQIVDVSAQESSVVNTFNVVPWWELCQVITKRYGSRRSGLASHTIQRQTWPCRDGFVSFVFTGLTGAKWNKAIAQWMKEEGMADEFLEAIDWDRYDTATVTQEFIDQLEARVGRFFLSHTMEELYQGSLERGAGLCPVTDVSYHYRDPQLEARLYWTEVDYPELGSHLTHLGPFVQATPHPLSVDRRAPLVGEHNVQVYRSLGLSAQELKNLKREGVI